jgi:hypothetical protein
VIPAKGAAMKKFILCTSLLVLLVGAEAKQLKVLFVGNSYTYVCNMPEIVQQMAEAKGHTLEFEQQTPGGCSFQRHWEEKKALEKMQNGRFDFVVFQNESFEPVCDPDNMMKYGKLLAAEADKAGARRLYYLTMAYKGPVKRMKGDTEEARRAKALFPEMNERLAAAYSQLAKETDGQVAPAGLAWKLAYEADPDLKLHAGDLSHPAPAGAYLTALVFYSSLFGEEPVDMPGKLTVTNRKKGKLQPLEIDIDPVTRKKLEAAAQKAGQEFQQNGRR